MIACKWRWDVVSPQRPQHEEGARQVQQHVLHHQAPVPLHQLLRPSHHCCPSHLHQIPQVQVPRVHPPQPYASLQANPGVGVVDVGRLG